MPSGNGVAARALLWLGHLLGETRYLDAAERALRAAWTRIEEHPRAYATLLRALAQWLDPDPQIVVRLPAGEPANAWRAQARALGARGLRVLAIDEGVSGLPEFLAARAPMAGGVAYICRGMQCLPPVRDPQALVGACAPSAGP